MRADPGRGTPEPPSKERVRWLKTKNSAWSPLFTLPQAMRAHMCPSRAAPHLECTTSRLIPCQGPSRRPARLGRDKRADAIRAGRRGALIDARGAVAERVRKKQPPLASTPPRAVMGPTKHQPHLSLSLTHTHIYTFHVSSASHASSGPRATPPPHTHTLVFVFLCHDPSDRPTRASARRARRRSMPPLPCPMTLGKGAAKAFGSLDL